MSSSDTFFTDAAAYERLMGRWSRRVGEVFLDWMAVPNGLRWVDIGCGTGAFTEELIKHCAPAAVAGVDPSAEQLAFARERHALHAAEFHVGDAQALPFPDESFDVVVMALVVHFLASPAKAVSEMARVARPGGSIATYAWDYSIGGSPSMPISDALKSLGFASPMPPGAAATTEPALQGLWRSAGLEEIEIRAIRIPVAFASFDEFWQAMTGRVGPVGNTVAALSPGDLARLRDRLRERSAGPGGRVVYEATANAIKGRKRRG